MLLTFIVRYSLWHYFFAPQLMVGVWSNILWYLGHLFSVGSLAETIFAPWKRVVAERTKRWDFEDFASAVVANFISRIIGAVMRIALVVIGRILQLCWVVFGAVFYVGWFLLPIVIAGTFGYGIALIFFVV